MSRRKAEGEGEKEKEKGKLVKMPGKGGAGKDTAEPPENDKKSNRKPRPIKGAKKALRHAVEVEVKKKSKEIAHHLVEKASSGDGKSTEMVLSLMDRKKEEGDANAKKKDGPSWAELLTSEPEWDEEDGEDGKKAG